MYIHTYIYIHIYSLCVCLSVTLYSQCQYVFAHCLIVMLLCLSIIESLSFALAVILDRFIFQINIFKIGNVHAPVEG